MLTKQLSPQELAACQQAYAARPFAVRWNDSHYSGEHRFHTFNEAFDYAQQQWAYINKRVASAPYPCQSFLGQSWIETPEGRISLRYYLLTKDVSSY
jgi:hypothetical protein